VEDLKITEMDGGSYVTAEVFNKGKPAMQVLPEALETMLAGIRFTQINALE
jgi:glycyl-tRNA synthetase